MSADAPPVLRSLRFWLFQVSGWLGFGAVMLAWALAYWSPQDAFVNKGILVLIGFALTLVLRPIYRRVLSSRPIPKVLTGVIVVACSFAFATVWFEGQSVLFQAYYSGVYTGRVNLALVPLGVGSLLYYGFVLLTWSLLYVGIHIWDESEYEHRRAENAEASAQVARLRALQAQLNPHLIFNTLNAISTLIDDGKNEEAKAVIVRLSEFLRMMLDTLDTPEITVAQEIQFLRCYLDIEHARFGARLRTTINATPAAMPALIPTLILQPLVENAVKHGTFSRELGGSIDITLSTNKESLTVTVADNGRSSGKVGAMRTGIGLSNTASRLAELYGKKASVEFAAVSHGGITTVIIPLRMMPRPTTHPPNEALS